MSVLEPWAPGVRRAQQISMPLGKKARVFSSEAHASSRECGEAYSRMNLQDGENNKCLAEPVMIGRDILVASAGTMACFLHLPAGMGSLGLEVEPDR